MPVAVNINNQNIRVLAAERNGITHWEKVALSQGLVKDGHILQPQAVAGTLKSIFSQTKLPQGEIAVCVTGMSFVYRILGLPKLKKADLREAVERAMQKEINVPLTDLYIDWQIVSEQAGNLDVFVLGAPRVMVDNLVHTFSLAGLKIASIDINPLALARLVNLPKAVIADFGQDWFDIVIVSEGLPVTLHSVAARGNFQELEDNLSQMSEEIRRTVDFFNLTHKDNAIKTGEHFFLSGINPTGDDSADFITRYLPESTPAPDGQLVYPSAFIPGDFAVLIGLLVKKPERRNDRSQKTLYHDINIDLLAGRSRITRKQLSFRQVLVPALIAAAIVLLTPLLIARNNTAAEVGYLESQLAQVNRDLNNRRLALSRIEAAEAQLTGYLVGVETIRLEREVIAGPGNLAASLSLIEEGLPEGLFIAAIVSDAGQIIIEGWATDRTAVLDYSSYLSEQVLFQEARIGSIEDMALTAAVEENIGPAAVSFKIVLERQSKD